MFSYLFNEDDDDDDDAIDEFTSEFTRQVRD